MYIKNFDKKAFGFGTNYLGVLGLNKDDTFDFPIEIFEMKDVVQASSGYYHTLVLKEDGTVWAWGYNLDGQLGDGTRIDIPYPIQVIGFENISTISAGFHTSYAVDKNGDVYLWGYLSPYDIIDYLCEERWERYCLKPGKIIDDDIKDIVSISVGSTTLEFVIALKKDGTVWGWGYNGFYTHGPDKDYPYPTKIDIENVKAISAGYDHVLALKKDGTVWAWGYGYLGQLGDGKYHASSKPVKVKNIENIIEIAAGQYFSMALRNDGTVFVWGDNERGELGNGSVGLDSNVPIKVEGIGNVKNISAKGMTAMALTTSGEVWTWGGWCGYKDSSGSYYLIDKPIKIQDLYSVKKIFQGGAHQIFIKEDGSLWARGNNYYGQLGIGEFGYEPYPKAINTIDDLVQVSGGYLFSAGLSKDGTVWTWGYNYYGQLGNGKTKDEMLYSLAPVKVLNLENVIQISAGSEFGLALKSDGTIWKWGKDGNCINGNCSDTNIPYQVQNIENVVKIEAGDHHWVALKNDGAVWESYGTGIRKVPNLENIIDIAADESYSIALKNDGTVWGCGSNSACQLGLGYIDYYGHNVPFKVKDLSNIISISAGERHSLALRDDGKVFVWGYGAKWTYIIYPTEKLICTPEEMEGLPPISKVYAGYYSSIVVDKDGYLWGWGLNLDGQLGIGKRSVAEIEPKKIEGIRNPISVGMGTFHTLVIGEYELKAKPPLK